ncbi:hypothetical protein Glove_123g48 [Diversispora epigaea]|uniref:Uncharacterized protein n=1 Tax=Diversispora epigaea TaxID=1348612 RepID=A0A397J141_9GLOM|nr:hypothetical protein Glove_123g48 [Diversispora epigaea]
MMLNFSGTFAVVTTTTLDQSSISITNESSPVEPPLLVSSSLSSSLSSSSSLQTCLEGLRKTGEIECDKSENEKLKALFSDDFEIKGRGAVELVGMVELLVCLNSSGIFGLFKFQWNFVFVCKIN